MRPNKTGADGKPKVPGANKDEQLKTLAEKVSPYLNTNCGANNEKSQLLLN